MKTEYVKCVIVLFVRFEDFCALVIQSWWHEVCEEQRNIRVPSVRPPTMADSYSTFSTRITQRSRMSVRPLTRVEAAKIIQRAWRKHVVSDNNYLLTIYLSVYLVAIDSTLFSTPWIPQRSLAQIFRAIYVWWRA